MGTLHPDTLRQLNESVLSFIQNAYDFATRRRIIASVAGYSQEHWKAFAELGWLGIPFAESYGGLGGELPDTLGVMDVFGRSLVVEPYLATVGLGGLALQAGTNETVKREILPRLIRGELMLALAYEERESQGNPARVDLVATPVDADYVLTGSKIAVLNAPAADYLVVSARTYGTPLDTDGITLFLVDRTSAGVELLSYPTADGFRAANIGFHYARVPATAAVTAAGQGYAALSSVIDQAIMMLCAEAVGAMDVLVKRTIDYCKTRRQFGVPIASFQVLQHRMADMYIALERTRSLCLATAAEWGNSDGRARRVSALKVQVGKAGRYIGQQAIQLHGGIGMTDELDVGHYFKRLTIIDTLFGNSLFHLHRMNRLATSRA